MCLYSDMLLTGMSGDTHLGCLCVLDSRPVCPTHTWLLQTNRKRRQHLSCCHLLYIKWEAPFGVPAISWRPVFI